MWKVKTLEELSSLELLEILQLRIDTFVVEQNRIYHEVDDKDKIAYHIFNQNKASNAVESYARIIATDEEVVIGRVTTNKSLRGSGQGKVLMEHVIEVCQKHFPNMTIKLESQKQVVPFYEKLGFKSLGEPYIFEQTPHVEMLYTGVIAE